MQPSSIPISRPFYREPLPKRRKISDEVGEKLDQINVHNKGSKNIPSFPLDAFTHIFSYMEIYEMHNCVINRYVYKIFESERFSRLNGRKAFFTKQINPVLPGIIQEKFKDLTYLKPHKEILDLSFLQILTRLTDLDLENSDAAISDHIMPYLTTLTNLRSLNLKVHRIVHNLTDEGLGCLTIFNNLTGLNLNGSLMTNITLDRITHLTKLSHLNIGFNPEINDSCLTKIIHFKNLTHLTLDWTNISDMIYEFQNLTNLNYLNVRDSKITDVGMSNIKYLTNLTYLNLIGTKITVTGISNIAYLTNLIYLNACDRILEMIDNNHYLSSRDNFSCHICETLRG